MAYTSSFFKSGEQNKPKSSNKYVAPATGFTSSFFKSNPDKFTFEPATETYEENPMFDHVSSFKPASAPKPYQMPSTRDSDVRANYAKNNPAMTGGAVGAYNRAVKTADVRTAVAGKGISDLGAVYQSAPTASNLSKYNSAIDKRNKFVTRQQEEIKGFGDKVLQEQLIRQNPMAVLGQFGAVPGAGGPQKAYDVNADKARIAELEKTINDKQAQLAPSAWGMPTAQDTTAEREELAALQQKVYQYDQGQALAEYDQVKDNPMFDLIAEAGKSNMPVLSAGSSYKDAQQAVDVGNLSEDEKSIYYYLLNTDPERAAQYLADMRETLNQRQGQKIGQSITNIDNGFVRSAITGVAGFGMGLDQFESGTKQLFTNERLPTSTGQFASQEIRSGLDDVGPDIFGASLGQALYDATTVAGNMAPSILAGSITGGLGAAPAVSGAVGSATLGLSAGGNAYNEMKAKGYTDAQARSYGALTAVSESGLQYLMGGIGALGGGGGKLTELAKGVERAWLRVPAQLVLNMAKEGGEEALQEILSPVLESIATGAKYNPANIEDIAYSGIMGALMGVFGGEYGKSTPNVASSGNMETQSPAVNAVETLHTMDASGMVTEQGNTMAPVDGPSPAAAGIPGQTTVESDNNTMMKQEFAPGRDTTNNSEIPNISAESSPVQAVNTSDVIAPFMEVPGQHIATNSPNIQSIGENIETNIENRPDLQQNEVKTLGLIRDAYVEANIPAETVNVIDQTAKMLGLRVAFADSVAEGKANAQISGDEILIEQGNKNPVTFLYGHEVTHRMQEVSPAEYQALKDVLAPRLADEAKTLESLYRGNGLDMSTDKAMDEAVANEVGRLMEGGTALEEFIQRNSQNKPLLQRFLDAVRSLVGKLTGKSKRSVQTVEARLARALDASVSQDGNLATNESVDIQYSVKGSEDAKAMADLEKENKLLRERVERWRGQLKKTDGITLQEGAVYKVARELAKEFDANVDVEQLSKDLYELYNGIAHGIHAHGLDAKNGLDLDAIQQTANDIGATLSENSMVDDVSYYEEYKDVRDYFRSQPLRISAEDRAGISDYGDFRKRNFGRMKLQDGPTNVDQVYKEMAEQRPELFDENVETNVEDQLLRIEEVLDTIYTKRTSNPFASFLDAAAVDMGNEILNRYFDIPVVKRTFADAQQGRVDKQKELSRAKIQELRTKNRENTAKIRAKDKAAYKERMAQEVAKRKTAVEEGILIGKFEQGKKAAQDASQAKARSDARLDKARAKTAEAVEKGKTKTAEAVAKGKENVKKVRDKGWERLETAKAQEKEKGRERLEKHKDSQARKEMRAKIMRETQPLRQRLSRPTDKAHIPETMKKAVSDVLQAINLSSRYDVAIGADGKEYRVTRGTGNETSLTKSFKELQQRYKKAVTDGEITQDDLLTGNGEFGGLFDEVISMGDIPILEMTKEQLETVLDTVKVLKHLIVTANQTLSDARYATISGFANKVKIDTATRRAKRSLTKGHILLDMETPYTFFSHYGQAGKDIYRMLRNAQDLQTTRLNTITRLTREAVNSSAVKNMEKERFEFETSSKVNITLTKAHILDLYLGMKRKQAAKHILDGGLYQPEIAGTSIRHGDQRIEVTIEDVTNMIKKLSPEEKAIGDRLQKISSGILAEWGNEASMRVFGYKKFLDKNYWAIHVAKETINSTVERGNGQPRSTKNAGMAKPLTKNASNPVNLMSAFGNFSQQAAEMLDYSVWLAPMEDATKILNYKFKDDNGVVTGQTMKGLLNEKGGSGSTEYWLALMKDIQNGIGGDNDSKIGKIAEKLTGSMKGAAVGANLSVILQQPTAYLRAAFVLNPANMVKGIAKGVTGGNGWAKAMKYAPIASRKAAGGFDIRSAYNVADRIFDQRTPLQRFNDAMGAGAGMMDNLTWGKLWNSCEWEIAQKRPGLDVGSSDFYGAVAELFTDVIDQTQVVDGVLQRSQVMRSSNGMVKQMTSFMGEPIMSYNMVTRAYDNWVHERDKPKRKAALKKLSRAVSAFVVAGVSNAMVRSMIAGYRDDDKEKDYWEKVMSAFTGITGDEEAVLDTLWNIVLGGEVGNAMNPLNSIPLASDAISLLQGYTVERMDISVIGDLLDAVTAFIGSADGTGPKTPAYVVKQLVTAASKMAGISATNILRDVWALTRTFAQASGSIPFQYEMEKAIYNLSNSSNKGNYYDLMFLALQDGDFGTYDHIRSELIDTMTDVDAKTIGSAMQSKYKDAVKKDSNFTLSQDALDKINIIPDYFTAETPDEFDVSDLTSAQAKVYEDLRGDTYRGLEDDFVGMGIMSGISDEHKDKLLGSANNYAEALALEVASDGEAPLDVTWMNWVHAGEKYGVSSEDALLFKLAVDTVTGDKDEDGNTIMGSKKENVVDQAVDWMPWLTDEQMDYLMSKDWTPESEALKALKEAAFYME